MAKKHFIQKGQVWGAFLILLGLMLLFREYLPIKEYAKTLWPVVLIFVGIAMMLNLREKAPQKSE